MELLKSGDIVPPTIVFVNQKKGVDVLAKSLEKMGVSMGVNMAQVGVNRARISGENGVKYGGKCGPGGGK